MMLVWAMRTLSLRQRQAVVLRYLVGLGEGEVAETMGRCRGRSRLTWRGDWPS